MIVKYTTDSASGLLSGRGSSVYAEPHQQYKNKLVRIHVFIYFPPYGFEGVITSKHVKK